MEDGVVVEALLGEVLERGGGLRRAIVEGDREAAAARVEGDSRGGRLVVLRRPAARRPSSAGGASTLSHGLPPDVESASVLPVSSLLAARGEQRPSRRAGGRAGAGSVFGTRGSLTGCDHGTVAPPPRERCPARGRPPDAACRLIGRALNATVAHAPWLWPVLRRPMTTLLRRSANTWDERTGAPGVDHLAPLAVAVTKIDRRPERALDIGTGTGVAALFVAREFPHASVRGVDVSEEMIRRAKAKVGLDPEGRVAFRVADASAPSPTTTATSTSSPSSTCRRSSPRSPGSCATAATRSSPRAPATGRPFYTPDAVLERGFERHGMATVKAGRHRPGLLLRGAQGGLSPARGAAEPRLPACSSTPRPARAGR